MDHLQPSVLYVEDEARSRRVMHMMLVNSMKLPHVTIFEDSQDFLARVEALNPKPDVIFLDIHLTPHDGFEMLQMLRTSQLFADAKIVALTASVMNEEISRLKEVGFDGCIAKRLIATPFQNYFHSLFRVKKSGISCHEQSANEPEAAR